MRNRNLKTSERQIVEKAQQDSEAQKALTEPKPKRGEYWIGVLILLGFPLTIIMALYLVVAWEMSPPSWEDGHTGWWHRMDSMGPFIGVVLCMVCFVCIILLIAVVFNWAERKNTLGWVFAAIGLVALIIMVGNLPSTQTVKISDANKGYMTRSDDELFTATEIKKGHGESLTKDEQDFSDKAESGKLGKPYGNRPDKDKDGQGP